MDTRKIQSVGGGTYTISLPKEWGKERDIEPGDVVNVHQHLDGILAVQTQETESNSPIQSTIQFDHYEPERLEQSLRAAYAAGLKELVLVSNTEFSTAQRQVIDEVAKKLTGVSVDKTSNSEITVKVLLKRDEISVTQSVRQLKFIALSMHKSAIKSLQSESAATHLTTRDEQADRLYALINRSFTRSLARLDEVDALGYTRPELFELWETTRELERVADHAEGIAKTAPAVDDTVPQSAFDKLQQFGCAARSLIVDSVSVIVGDASAEVAYETLLARDELCKQIKTYADTGQLMTKSPQLRPVLHRIQRTAEHGGNIAEIGLQHGVRHREFTDTETIEGNVDFVNSS